MPLAQAQACGSRKVVASRTLMDTAIILRLFHKDLAPQANAGPGHAVASIVHRDSGNAAMDALQEKQERLQILPQHCAWFGRHGDVGMQHQLATECDGLTVEIDQLQRGIRQSPKEPNA